MYVDVLNATRPCKHQRPRASALVAVSLLRPEAGLAKRPRARRVSPWGGMAETSHDSDDEEDDEEEED